ncbi:MAG: choice-of-anchor B family protein [Actinomycetota bacterium]|nr:choice-of-anchor B family protein [Actinomycetota bacterium]
MSRRPHRPAPVRLAVALAASLTALVPFVVHVPAATAAPVTNRPCVDGFAGNFECKDVDLEVFIPMADLGGGRASDVWGWRDPSTEREYALMGSTRGLIMVDITKPSEPVYLGNLLKPDGQFIWQDVEVYRDHAFVVCDLAPCGMQVFDLTRLRGVTTAQTWTPDLVYPVTMTTHTIDINPETGFAYLNGGYLAAPAHIVNVNIPKAPVPAGFISDDGYTHDSFCRIYRGPDTRFTGKEICFNFNEDTITIYDVTNKAAITRLARVTYPGASYVHSGWLTQDSRYLLSTDETDNKPIVFVWDVERLDAPRLHFQYATGTAAIDHNPYIVGRWAYLANYRAGMRVLDTEDVAGGTLTEIAYFDVMGGPNTAGYDGAWTVHPFLPSGNVLISGMSQGLFVVDPTFDDPPPSEVEEASR